MIKATAQSLTEFPDLNAIWDGGLQQKKDINIGFVVSLRTGGIIVPAIHQVHLKNVDEIEDFEPIITSFNEAAIEYVQIKEI